MTLQGGSAGRSDSQWASRAPEELRKMVSARRGWGTQRANPGAPAAQHLCPSTLRGTCTQGANPGAHAARRLCSSTLRGPCTQWDTTGAPDAFHAATSARRGPGTQGANPGAPAAQRRCSSAPGGSRAQWATAGARAEQGTWGSRTQKHREAGCGRSEDGGVGTTKTAKQPPQQPTPPHVPTICQLLGAADAQTAHPATSGTAPAHQPLGSSLPPMRMLSHPLRPLLCGGGVGEGTVGGGNPKRQSWYNYKHHVQAQLDMFPGSTVDDCSPYPPDGAGKLVRNGGFLKTGRLDSKTCRFTSKKGLDSKTCRFTSKKGGEAGTAAPCLSSVLGWRC